MEKIWQCSIPQSPRPPSGTPHILPFLALPLQKTVASGYSSACTGLISPQSQRYEDRSEEHDIAAETTLLARAQSEI